MAKGDIFKGTVLWCKAMSTTPKTTQQGVAVDLALHEALNLIKRGKFEGERSAADAMAEELIDGISDELAAIERKARVTKKRKT
jgi:hypothetical protein